MQSASHAFQSLLSSVTSLALDGTLWIVTAGLVNNQCDNFVLDILVVNGMA
jgi:hypothetical protein